MKAAVVLLAVLLLATACGEPRHHTGTRSGPLPAAQVDASALPRDYPHTVRVRDDGRTLLVRGKEGGCSHVSAAVTRQDADTVHVLFTESRPPGRPLCTMDLRTPELTVRLAEPLGDRVAELSARSIVGKRPG
ncbi:hypothetical protein [Sciscionella marina]|uniref:hypothetical protein n=1 Tax=Sciscionella marina TaxID=508770 RepID=UPI00037B40E1|nr:hypothetical protein [Sciscionella marina]